MLAGQGHDLYADGRLDMGQSESFSQNNQRLDREPMLPRELATMPPEIGTSCSSGACHVLFPKVQFEAPSQLQVHGGGKQAAKCLSYQPTQARVWVGRGIRGIRGLRA